MVGTELFQSLSKVIHSEYVALTTEQWEPTPFMVDVNTSDRIDEIKQWCFHRLGPESSPMHSRFGLWRQSFVTIHGKSWFGFSSEAIMNEFLNRFPNIS